MLIEYSEYFYQRCVRGVCLLQNAVTVVLCIVWYIKVFRKKYTENYFKVGIPETEEKLLNYQEAEV